MEITNHIKYDIAKRGIPPVVDAVQGEENSRSIELSVFANGSAFPVDGCVCSLAFKKPDGTSGWYDTMPDGTVAYSINGNVISIKIASQVLTVAGEVNSVIRIESTDGSDRATTFPMIINVSEDPAIDAIKSDNYYAVQNWNDVNSAIDELRKMIGSGGGDVADVIAPLIADVEDVKETIDEVQTELEGVKEAVENSQKTYELIEDFTLAEDATSITRNTEPNGNHYNFSAVRIFVEATPIEDVNNGQVIFSLKDASQKTMIFHQMNSGITNAARRTSLVARNDCGLIEYYAINAGGESIGNVISKPAYNGITPWRNVCSIGLSTYSAPHYPAGTRIVIYAIRG